MRKTGDSRKEGDGIRLGVTKEWINASISQELDVLLTLLGEPEAKAEPARK